MIDLKSKTKSQKIIITVWLILVTLILVSTIFSDDVGVPELGLGIATVISIPAFVIYKMWG
ncbi:hypothetical protein A2W45_04105 [Candidatus Curtissbacteria bacterium RIFCSPHIGHO2_12_41_11]|uniref:Uncharacterized protein n=2 Tax=Candidatus Curtissiibacteriota TaxID=1752717 RepID=A0A1F5H5S3_9BACT|nr:MAG: hypothetical protein A3D07_03915 [Candidatus Curtissbacteria bacterium RIFCSPHIGHO2_02_FULL_42_15]OGD99427.1 MAG: hypothetical protein A2W45_04105 [Candidatus Curtissbacteria bacterium RIFCSPHIGHO2_12_41_11]